MNSWYVRDQCKAQLSYSPKHNNVTCTPSKWIHNHSTPNTSIITTVLWQFSLSRSYFGVVVRKYDEKQQFWHQFQFSKTSAKWQMSSASMLSTEEQLIIKPVKGSIWVVFVWKLLHIKCWFLSNPTKWGHHFWLSTCKLYTAFLAY